MNSTSYFLFTTIICVLLCSCGSSTEHADIPAYDSVVYIHVSEEQITDEPLPILAEILHIMPLELTAESALGDNFQLIFLKDRLYILDAFAMTMMENGGDGTNQRVLMFDTLGQFRGMLGGRGRGPGEYAFPRTVQVSLNDEVYVYCGGKSSLIFYSKDGQFLREWRTPFRSANSAIMEDFVFFENFDPQDTAYHVGYLPFGSDSIRYDIPYTDEARNLNRAPQYGSLSFQKYGSSYFIGLKRTTDVYELRDSTVVHRYHLDIAGMEFFQRKSLDRMNFRAMEWLNLEHELNVRKSDGKDQLNETYFLKTREYLRFNFNFNWDWRLRTILYDTRSGETLVGMTMQDGLVTAQDVANRLLDMVRTVHEGYFVAVLNTEELHELYAAVRLFSAEDRKRFYGDQVALDRLVQSRSMGSNPVLVKFSLKGIQLYE